MLKAQLDKLTTSDIVAMFHRFASVGNDRANRIASKIRNYLQENRQTQV